MLYAPSIPLRFLLRLTCSLLAALAFALPAIAQQPGAPNVNETEGSPVDVLHADSLVLIRKDGKEIQKLLGYVRMRQDSVYMSCDSATIENEVYVLALGKVVIQQGDSTNAFCDSLRYDGLLRQAEMFGEEVILVNKDQQLFTTELHYDLNTKIATYEKGATLVQLGTQLTSRRGYYHVATDEAYFKGDVVVVDSQFTLRSDTLLFNTATQIVTFLGPTLITTDSSRVYCEDGFYDSPNRLGVFTQRAQFVKGEQKATGDTIRYFGDRGMYELRGNAFYEEGSRQATAAEIRYDERADKTYLIGNAHYKDEDQDIEAAEIVYDAKNEIYTTRGRSKISDPPQILEADQVDYEQASGIGIASGAVWWRDTSANLIIGSANMRYDKASDYLLASGGNPQAGSRPLLVTVLENDSLFMSADTLIGTRADTVAGDSARILRAFFGVRIFKSDLQAICDSLIYNTSDSTFLLLGKQAQPMIWSDTSQFSADTLLVKLRNNQIDTIFLRNRSMIINSPDEIFFNQIKGKNVVVVFQNGDLRKVFVDGNAESVYYAVDEEGAYVGVNKMAASEMLLYFDKNQVEDVRYYTQPKGNFMPMREADHEKIKLENFRWVKDGRPRKKEDVFILNGI